MSAFKIEKDVPIPDSHQNTRWPFGKMKVGDSFEVPDAVMGKVAVAMSYYGKRHGMKFSKRGKRVWRIK
jgi:hypothetical protein